MLNVRMSAQARGTGSPGAAGRCSARSRSISSRRCRPATPSSSPARCCASRASARTSAIVIRAPATRSEDPVLCRRQVPALDLPRRAGARHAGRSRSAGSALPEQVARLAAHPAGEVGAAEARRPAGRDLSARRPASTWSPIPFEGRLAHQTLGMLLTRRLERARRAAARLRRHRLFARRLGAGRPRRACSQPASRRSPSCSTRTCWATTSRPGSPRAGC